MPWATRSCRRSALQTLKTLYPETLTALAELGAALARDHGAPASVVDSALLEEYVELGDQELPPGRCVAVSQPDMHRLWRSKAFLGGSLMREAGLYVKHLDHPDRCSRHCMNGIPAWRAGECGAGRRAGQ